MSRLSHVGERAGVLLELRPPLWSLSEIRASYSFGDRVEAKLAVGQIGKPSIYYGSSPRLEALHIRATYFKMSAFGR